MGASFSSIREEHDNESAPNSKRILVRPTPFAWVAEAQEAVLLRAGPTYAAIVGGHGLPQTQWFPFRIDKAQGVFFVKHTTEVDVYVRSLPLSVIKQPQDEPRVLKSSVPPD